MQYGVMRYKQSMITFVKHREIFPSAFSFLLPGYSFLSFVVLEECWSTEDKGEEERYYYRKCSMQSGKPGAFIAFASTSAVLSIRSQILVSSSSRDSVCLWQKQTLSAGGGDMIQDHTAPWVCTTFSFILPVKCQKDCIISWKEGKKKKNRLKFDFTGRP